jgi:hypothetical protein
MTQGVATKTEETFRMDCSVRCEIAASPERIWALLTNATELRASHRGRERLMARNVVVQYKIKADRLEEHEALLRDVFSELSRTAPDGVRYGAF